jgi:hypothetical protein
MKRIVGSTLLLLTCLLSCEEEKVEVPTAAPGTMVMTVDGVPMSAWFVDSPDYSAVAHNYVQRLDIEANFQRKWINGTVIGTSDLIISLDEVAEGEFKLRGKCTALTEPGSAFYRALQPELNYYNTWQVERFFVGIVTITKLDFKNKLTSGTFHLKMKNDFSEDVIILEGSFTDLPVF